MTDANKLEEETVLVRELEAELITLLQTRPSYGRLSLILSFHNSELKGIATKRKATMIPKTRKARTVIESASQPRKDPVGEPSRLCIRR